ncbi:MAG: hypothetical protein FH748_00375 [Balneolaceae bacterium]|nr:hypothetical protein [Balneolaceae bacterium]
MHYPIFNAIVDSVQNQLDKRDINTQEFKKWQDNKIHAVGLELITGLDQASDYMDALSINFDWDSFRETSLAQNLSGMESHPFLTVETLTQSSINPTIDVEMSWLFNVEKCQPEVNEENGNYRIEKASRWMESISKKVNTLLAEDDIITRWHIEIDGDLNGRYLSAINLISYFQYQLSAPKNLSEVQTLVTKKMQDLLLKANKVISISNETLAESIAA